MGLGLVRAVDMAQRVLYVLSPVAPELLERVDVLEVAGGRLELPAQLLQAGDVASPYLAMAACCLSAEAAGAVPQRSRNNLLRVGLMNA